MSQTRRPWQLWWGVLWNEKAAICWLNIMSNIDSRVSCVQPPEYLGGVRDGWLRTQGTSDPVVRMGGECSVKSANSVLGSPARNPLECSFHPKKAPKRFPQAAWLINFLNNQ